MRAPSRNLAHPGRGLPRLYLSCIAVAGSGRRGVHPSRPGDGDHLTSRRPLAAVRAVHGSTGFALRALRARDLDPRCARRRAANRCVGGNGPLLEEQTEVEVVIVCYDRLEDRAQ